MHLMFVCTGNICRSPYAERRAAQLAPELTVSSAGTDAMVGDPMYPEMAEQVTRRGGDPDGFISRQLDPVLARQPDLILTASARHRRWIIEDWPELARRTFTLDQFTGAAVRVEDATGPDLIDRVHRMRPRADPLGDIPDPYRRGPAAAAQCADLIDRHLTLILPRLVG
ncbi:low molecular weight phosphatase family protein [Granulicoccus phenolivorans]|uniref:arsenate reductase/protein-tyrosine-phosphatase family protein n=1 Tax=Granulicoccus phenolivorans TaxID=266854 RepID=UPI0003F7B775|nr:low molecular weight phosphatase family protein [Granulicoccus phenolivorans]